MPGSILRINTRLLNAKSQIQQPTALCHTKGQQTESYHLLSLRVLKKEYLDLT